ncbi:hypothetical protein RYX36_006971 [Vicia faba]
MISVLKASTRTRTSLYSAVFILVRSSSMAQNSTSDTRFHANAAVLLEISKDVQGSDNHIPLSPQWLLPKPGEMFILVRSSSMTQNSTSDTRFHANTTTPSQISKDVQGSDNIIPLSP